VPFRGHAYASTLLDGRVRGEGGLDTQAGEGGLDTQASVQLLDGAKHVAEGGGLLSVCGEHRASNEREGVEKGGSGRGVARIIGSDLAPHGDEAVSARSASIDESHDSGSEGGVVGDHKGRRSGCSVADARGSGGGRTFNSADMIGFRDALEKGGLLTFV
jgi:hypothetical protein